MGIFSSKGKFTNTDFSMLPFVTPVTPIKGLPHKAKGLDGWPDDKLPRNIVFRVDLMESALDLCRRGLAVAYLPKFVVELHNSQVKSHFTLQSLAPPKKLKKKKQCVYVIKRKSDIEHPCFKKIATELRNL
jgi:DNA-binding transcriptional LysR family regulator